MSAHVILFEPRFWGPIERGEKVHTIRPPRKRRIDVGDGLSLRGWTDKPYRSPQREIMQATCVAIREIWIGGYVVITSGDEKFRLLSEWELDQFARTDGFESWRDMQTFAHWAGQLPFFGEFIQWGIHPMLTKLGDFRGRTL